MTVSLTETTRGRIYLSSLAAAGLLLVLAPAIAWVFYDLRISQGGNQFDVLVYVTGFGSILETPGVSGVSFTFPILQNWWYGALTLVIGVIALLLSALCIRRPEIGGLIGFAASFVNISPALFFVGRSTELDYMVWQFAQAIQGAGYTLLGGFSSWTVGFILEIIGTFLLPASSILILSNATRLRMKMEEEDKKKRKALEEEAPRESIGGGVEGG